MKTIKENLKTSALKLREMKQAISTGMSTGENMGGTQWTLQCNKQEHRYNHIAYCMIRGREYSQIENKVRPLNEINFTRLNNLITLIKEEMAERNPKEESQDA